jgi:hypothetical protein
LEKVATAESQTTDFFHREAGDPALTDCGIRPTAYEIGSLGELNRFLAFGGPLPGSRGLLVLIETELPGSAQRTGEEILVC